MKVGDVSGAAPLDRGSGHNRKANRKTEANERHQQDRVDLSSEAKQKARETSGAGETARSEKVYERPTPERKNMDEDEQKLVRALVSRTDEENDSSDVRQKKIEEAREKMKSGDYSDRKVIDQVARRIIEQFGLSNR